MPPADETLREAVLRTLASDSDLASGQVRVGVLNGVAHLAGQVTSKHLWERAAAVTAGVPGVRGVVNRIAAPGAPSPARTIQLTPPEEWSNPTDDQVP